MSDTLPPEAPNPSPTMGAGLGRLLGIAAALVSILAYRAVGDEFYSGFRIPQGSGMYVLLPEELAALGLFMLFGTVAVAGLAGALNGLGAVGELGRRLAAARFTGAAVAVWVGVATFAIGRFVLGHAATCDDEHVYRFVAQTLRTGALTAPSPGGDLAFYREQFVVLTDTVRFGKYPIGHPLLLAVGQALGAEGLVGPALTAAMVVLVHLIGRRVFSLSTANLACLFLAFSPQVLLTGATALSQPTSALALLGAVACLASSEPPGPRAWAGAGACLGYGVLTRPLPGALFVAVAGIVLLVRHAPWRRQPADLLRVVAFSLPVLAAAGVLFFFNRLQTGRALTSGYQAFHATGGGAEGLLGLMQGNFAIVAMSVAGTLFRANVWLLGWPVSFVLCVFARSSPRAILLWAMAAADLAYRVLAPKVGVGGTGPLYLYEAVPLLALLSADGAIRLVARADAWGYRRAVREGLLALFLAATLVNLTLFLPPRLQDLRRMALAQHAVTDLVARTNQSPSLVFHNGTVPPWTRLSWAYFPRVNSPTLDDRVLFLRLPPDPGRVPAALDLWRGRYPERAAYYFEWLPEQEPRLVPFQAWASRLAAPLPAGP
jgi:hypothetical protein